MKKKKQSASLKKHVSILSISAICALTLSACGGGGSDGSSNTGGNNNGGGTVNAGDAYAYVSQRGADAAMNSILKCNLSGTDGTLSGCVDSGAVTNDATPAPLPGPLALAVLDSNAYVLNSTVVTAPAVSAYSLYKCALDLTSGNLSACVNQESTNPDDPEDIRAIGASDFALYKDSAYMTQLEGSQVFKCAVDPTTKSISNCGGQDVVRASLAEPAGIAFLNDRAYITNSQLDLSGVQVCTLATEAVGTVAVGDVTACADAALPAGATAPVYPFDPVGAGNDGVKPTGIAIANSSAYIVAEASNNVVRCDIDSAGTFSACTPNTMTGVTPGTLGRIFIYGNYAYITHVTADTPAVSSVFKCSIGADKNLVTCEAASGIPFTGTVSDIKAVAKPTPAQ